MQQQLEEEWAQAQRRVAWLPGECSRFEIIITEVRFKVQLAREEATVKAGGRVRKAACGATPAGC
jgi:hypothetical protein